MCGIFGIINHDDSLPAATIQTCFEKGRGRGPEMSHLTSVNIKAIFGFHRLAINGVHDVAANQPIQIGDISLICNGEIYNYRELYELMGVEPHSKSDCEVIIHLYLRYGIEQTVQMLDGVFAFALLDGRIQYPNTRLYLARDPYGVRPLYWVRWPSSSTVAFASEVKSLIGLLPTTASAVGAAGTAGATVAHFPPGHFAEFSLKFQVNPEWTGGELSPYHTPGFSTTGWMNTSYEEVFENIRQFFTSAVTKRCITTERPIACLLSGGLDSSLVAALVQDYQQIHSLPPVETYSIGLADSVDLKYARKVADYLGTNHTEIVLTEEDFIAAIPEVIGAIESYDTTTVRASIGNYLLGKYIAANSEAKVIFNGDGSDELMGGYLYMHACPDPVEYDRESRRLLRDIHAFDVLRSDKSISSHGLEPRTPFLDRAWVQYYLSLPPAIRYLVSRNGYCEKGLIRNAFSQSVDPFLESVDTLLESRMAFTPNPLSQSGMAFTPNPLLPKDILWRRKEAFSDGVSCHGRSLYTILQEFTSKQVTPEMVQNAPWTHNKPTTPEQYYYRSIFEKFYPGQGKLVPYLWMPKYVDAADASARTLAIYADT